MGNLDNLDSRPLPETGRGRSFKDLVLERQALWRSLKRPAYKEFPQGIEVSRPRSEKIYAMAAENLPDYIPAGLQRQLIESHPTPIFMAGLLMDKRVLEVDQKLVPEITSAGEVGDEDLTDWDNGIEILTEIAVNALTDDILEIYKNKTSGYAAAAKIGLTDNRSSKSYHDGLKYVESFFMDSDELIKFRRQLVLATLSGETAGLDRTITSLGYTGLNAFAIGLGKNYQYLPEIMIGPKTNQDTRINLSLLGGLYFPAFPGVINSAWLSKLPTPLHASLSIVNAMNLMTNAKTDNPIMAGLSLLMLGFNSYFALKPAMRKAFEQVHEICHYLGQGMDHYGLLRIKY